MQTEERTQSPPPPETRGRTGLLAAAAAFAPILLIVGAAAWLAGTDPEPAPPATTVEANPTTTVEPTTTVATPEPPPTTRAPVPTTVAAVVSAEEQTAIDSYIAALNAGDVSAQMELLSPDMLIWMKALVAGGEESPLPRPEDDALAGALGLDAAINTEVRLSNCQRVDEARVRCSGDWSDDALRAVSMSAGASITFAVNLEGLISHLTLHPNAAAMFTAHGLFADWLDAEYPTDVGRLWAIP